MMIKYLNAKPAIDGEWFNTGDRVKEIDSELIILGRDDETINISGNLFLPSEVENHINRTQGVIDCIVKTAPHPAFGNYLTATIQIRDLEEKTSIMAHIQRTIHEDLPRYAHPSRFRFTTDKIVNDRYKKDRSKF